MPDQDGAIIDRFYAGLASGDLDDCLACMTPDARVWHCFDGVAQDRASSVEGWQALVAGFPVRKFVGARRHPIPGGFMQQHMMIARTATGAQIGWPICVVITLQHGLIARIDEYIDRAGRFEIADMDNAATPGL